MTPLQKYTLVVANGKLGEKEESGKNDGPFVSTLQAWLDQGKGWMEGQPWCATFATWCIYEAARHLAITPRIPKSGASSDLYSWFRRNGLILAKPVAGSLGLMRDPRPDSKKTHHHAFLVESVKGDVVNGIDGNWNNAVSKTAHLISLCDFGAIV